MTPPQRQRRHPTDGPPPEPAKKQGEGKIPERLYVLTGATEDGDRAELDLVTLIVARSDAPQSATPEQAALLGLCIAPCPWPSCRPISTCRTAW